MASRAVAWVLTLALLSLARADEPSWRDLGEVPGAEQHYPPQGMTFAGRRLVFTHHEQDRASALFTLDPQSMAITGRAALPPEASHTSGLGWDGHRLWAVDYNSHELYAFDLDATLAGGQAVVLGRWPTGLEGASALEWLELEGVAYLAISDFLSTSRSYLLPVSSVPGLGTASVADLSVCSWFNGRFSQGLGWDGHLLYEAVNRLGTDELRVYDIATAMKAGAPCEPELIARIPTGGPGVEDLASDGTRMWTSDERSWRFFVLDNLPALRAGWRPND